VHWLSKGIFRWPTLLLVSSLHLIWGILLVLDPRSIRITGLAALSALPGTAPGAAPTTHFVGLVLILASYFGFWAITRAIPSRKTLIALLPQQCFLILSATAALYSTVVGHYGDGVLRPHAFIGADQAVIVLIALAHVLVLVMMHLNYVFVHAETEMHDAEPEDAPVIEAPVTVVPPHSPDAT
jgi:hypothetical protein